MKIRQQLRLNSLVINSLILLAFFAALVSFNRIQQYNHKLIHIELPLEYAVLEMEVSAEKMVRRILKYVRKQDINHLESIQKSQSDFEKYTALALIDIKKMSQEAKFIQKTSSYYLQMKKSSGEIIIWVDEQEKLLKGLPDKAKKIHKILDDLLIPLLLKNAHQSSHLLTVYELKSKISDAFYFVYNFLHSTQGTCQQSFEKCNGRYRQLLQQLYQSELSEEEENILRQVELIYQSAYTDSVEIIKKANQINSLVSQLSIDLQKLNRILDDDLQATARESTKKGIDKVDGALDQVFFLLALITLIVVSFYFWSNFLLAKVINRGTKSLLDGIHQVHQGNLKTNISIMDKNELGEVAEFLNETINKLCQDDYNIKKLLRYNQLILNSSGDGIYGIDTEGKTTFVNLAAMELTGWSKKDLIGKNQHDLLHHTKVNGSEYPNNECPVYEVMKNKHAVTINNEVFWRKDGSSFPVEYTLSPIEEDNEVIGGVFSFRDVTERKLAEQKIHQLAMADPLTGLANRNQFGKYIDSALAWSKRSKKPFALLMLDLDHFKPVNDTYGHQVGDELLIMVGKILQTSCRETDRVSRLGGDEFAIILNGIECPSDVQNPVEKIINLLSQPQEIGTLILQIGVSIGISIYPNNSKNTEQLLRMADLALYKAKDDGRNTYRFYERSLEQ